MRLFPVFLSAAILLVSIASTVSSEQAVAPKATEPLKRLDDERMSALLGDTFGIECKLSEIGSNKVADTITLLFRGAEGEMEVFSRLPFQARETENNALSLSLPGTTMLGFLREKGGVLSLELLSSDGLLVGPCEDRTEIMTLALSYFLPVAAQESLNVISALEKKVKDAEEALRDQRSDFESQVRVYMAESEAKINLSKDDIKDLEDQLSRQKTMTIVAQQKAEKARAQLDVMEAHLNVLFSDPSDLIAWRVVIAHPDLGYPMKDLSFQDLRFAETSPLAVRCQNYLSDKEMERFNDLGCIRILQRNLLPPSN
ncbi:hypothetical protein [Antarctobacter jejuensis]|uniref:hypothetical protein n=1 Tax=Antarctobacter jejuensis TaxID=1439938 RepID=UPI003FD5F703